MATKVTTDDGSPEDEVAIPPECQDSVSDSSVSLTAGNENTLNTGKRDSKYVLDHEGHPRYLRLWRALLYLKEPLHEHVLLEINKLHRKLKEKMLEIENKKKDGINKKDILNNLLSKWLNNGTFDKSNKIYINNVNIKKWEDKPWETAKAFMQSGQTEGNNCPEDTDIMGILRLISSCMQFDDWLKVDAKDLSGHEKVRMVLTIRHSVGHSGSLCCTETEMEEGLKQIKILMEHMKRRFKSLAEDDNFSEDDKIIYQEAEKKMVDALRSVEKVKTDTDFEVMKKLVFEDICKSMAYVSSDVTQRQEIAKVQLQYVTRKIFILLNDLYQGSKVFKDLLQDQGTLESFIIEANSDVKFLLVALEEKGMFRPENLVSLLRIIEPLHDSDDFKEIKTSMMECKTTLEKTSAIAFAIVYDVFILHCEADREEANTFRQYWLDDLQDLKPQAKMILYDEYVDPGTSHISALDNVFKDCRLVFIFWTRAFTKVNLSMFQAEMVMYYSWQKNEKSRVITVYQKNKDFEKPLWLNALSTICVGEEYAQYRLRKALKIGRENFLKSF